MVNFEILTPAKTTMGTSPWWDDAEQRLYWSDALGGLIYRTTPDGRELNLWKPADTAGVSSMVLRQQGGAIMASLSESTKRTGIRLFDFETNEVTTIDELEAGSPLLFNDSTTDSKGRLITGHSTRPFWEGASRSLRGQVHPPAKLYRIDADQKLQLIDEGYGITNGPGVSPDGKRLYVSDSWANVVYAYDLDPETGSVSNRSEFASFVAREDRGTNGLGDPDGIIVDSEGGVWITICRAGELRRYSPEGQLERTVALPILSVTNATFGGPNMDIMFVTSLMEAGIQGVAAPGDGQVGGCLLAVHGLGVSGVPKVRYQG